jgi:hypothetical protein
MLKTRRLGLGIGALVITLREPGTRWWVGGLIVCAALAFVLIRINNNNGDL